MDTHIQKLVNKRNDLQDQVRDYQQAIDACRRVCDHDPQYTGHGHNSDYYVCSKCGKETEE